MSQNNTVVITGSSRGIGKNILKIFSENNYNIWACSKNKNDNVINENKIIEKKFNIKINNIFFDFANNNEVIESAKFIINNSENINVLVNNAGIINTSFFQMTKIENIRKIFEVNFFSQLVFSQIIIKKMIKNKNGSIVNISSTSALDNEEGRLAYASSKSALLSASNVLSRELANFNIRVNTIAPGLTNTDMMTNNHNQNIIDYVCKKTSLKKIAEPEEIANTVYFLASEKSSHITGQTLRVDGGL